MRLTTALQRVWAGRISGAFQLLLVEWRRVGRRAPWAGATGRKMTKFSDDMEGDDLDAHPLAKVRQGWLRRGEVIVGIPGSRPMSKADLRYEQIARLAGALWQERYPDQEHITVWASPDCANLIAHERIKPGRRLRGKARYQGVESLRCDDVVTISEIAYQGRSVKLGATSGAFAFTFHDDERDESFQALLLAAYIDEEAREQVAVAVLPPQQLTTWAAFERRCVEVVRPRVRQRSEVYVIGGADAFFEPAVNWEDVILPAEVKDDLLHDVEAFFTQGVDIYRQLRLAPFRKLLLVGLPGTGKTMLCAAIAKRAIAHKRVVVYVSGSDMYGASFEKIHRALHIVAESRQPVVLIVEELDAYLHSDDKARVLNVLDGVESPINPKGVVMVATTNYPEVIDERIAKRPGRVDRIFVIPSIQDEEQALQMLKRYMGAQWRDEHTEVVPQLVNRTGAFVREVALQSRMLAAHAHQTEVRLEYLTASLEALSKQIEAGDDFLPKRPVGFIADSRNHRIRRWGFPAMPPDEIIDDDIW